MYKLSIFVTGVFCRMVVVEVVVELVLLDQLVQPMVRLDRLVRLERRVRQVIRARLD
jgi:hypothetical protein